VETCSSAHFQRFDETARHLTAERIRCCRHAEDLERVEHRLLDARHKLRAGYIHNLDRVWTRPELGALIVEVRNRLAQLRVGRDAPKPKGPRLDPTRMPLEAIERLIQRHPDLELVGRLRAERARRLAGQGPVK
jgi:hypothetical protein